MYDIRLQIYAVSEHAPSGKRRIFAPMFSAAGERDEREQTMKSREEKGGGGERENRGEGITQGTSAVDKRRERSAFR